VHDLDLESDTLHPRQQIRLEGGRPVLALPRCQRVRTVLVGEWALGVRASAPAGAVAPGGVQSPVELRPQSPEPDVHGCRSRQLDSERARVLECRVRH
jgi:hypothetical protein